IGFYRQENKTYGEIFFIRRGRLIGRHSTVLDKTKDVPDETLCHEFVVQFYSETSDIPKQIYTAWEPEDRPLLSAWLSEKSNRKTEVKFPVRGEKKKLTEMACKNARQSAVDYLLHNSGKNIPKSLLELKEKLGLAALPKRLESYDISHTMGTDPVGSMIVFADGKPAKSQYRRFQIKVAEGGDDLASLKEVLFRRFSHAKEEEEQMAAGTLDKPKFLPLPDAILLDGGKGQVAAIRELLALMDLEIPLFGMVKDERHRTRGLINDQGEEIGFLKTSESFRLLAGIQEEVHRFAISYHKTLRKKQMTGSILTEIEGVGEETRKKLLRHFKTMSAIKKATVDELSAVSGISRKTCENIYQFFHEIS
ncbi:MAG: excinuclease ABC subunit C, partial [Clostridia bacterium]|nr:excinuclease ABC subunit C [Clostridia bacterium]